MGPEADAPRMRTALRDLVALSAVPAVWVGRQPPAIAAGLADVLVNALYLDFAFVRLCDPRGGAAVEIVRGAAWQEFSGWLHNHLAVNGGLTRREIVRNVTSGTLRCLGIVIPIGVNAEGGLVAAACSRADFPSEIDQLLLSVAANHAATAFRTARLVDDHRRAEESLRESEQQLRKARDELEKEVAERTSELQRSETYLAEAQRLSRTGSFGWDVSSGKLYWSAETFRIFEGDPSTQPTAEFVLQRTHPQDRVRVQQTIDRAAQERTDLDFEHRLLMPDGSVKYVRVVGHASTEGGSGTLVFVGAITDITDRKRAEESLRAMQSELASASRLTTMGEFAASIAHEVNQPLMAIVTNAETCSRWLENENPDLDEARQAAERVVSNGHRAAAILRSIRGLARKSEPEITQFDINDGISDVLVLMRGELHQHDVVLETELLPDLPTIMGDRVQLQQVILNLISNGIDAMSTVTLRPRVLRVSSKSDQQGDVTIEVADTGTGLDPTKIEAIFDAFFTTKPEGMGMGLSICRSIVEAHGGRLWASPNVPYGSIFRFSMPVVADETDLRQRAPVPIKIITAPRKGRRGLAADPAVSDQAESAC